MLTVKSVMDRLCIGVGLVADTTGAAGRSYKMSALHGFAYIQGFVVQAGLMQRPGARVLQLVHMRVVST